MSHQCWHEACRSSGFLAQPAQVGGLKANYSDLPLGVIDQQSGNVRHRRIAALMARVDGETSTGEAESIAVCAGVVRPKQILEVVRLHECVKSSPIEVAKVARLGDGEATTPLCLRFLFFVLCIADRHVDHHLRGNASVIRRQHGLAPLHLPHKQRACLLEDRRLLI